MSVTPLSIRLASSGPLERLRRDIRRGVDGIPADPADNDVAAWRRGLHEQTLFTLFTLMSEDVRTRNRDAAAEAHSVLREDAIEASRREPIPAEVIHALATRTPAIHALRAAAANYHAHPVVTRRGHAEHLRTQKIRDELLAETCRCARIAAAVFDIAAADLLRAVTATSWQEGAAAA